MRHNPPKAGSRHPGENSRGNRVAAGKPLRHTPVSRNPCCTPAFSCCSSATESWCSHEPPSSHRVGRTADTISLVMLLPRGATRQGGSPWPLLLPARGPKPRERAVTPPRPRYRRDGKIPSALSSSYASPLRQCLAGALCPAPPVSTRTELPLPCSRPARISPAPTQATLPRCGLSITRMTLVRAPVTTPATAAVPRLALVFAQTVTSLGGSYPPGPAPYVPGFRPGIVSPAPV